MEHNSLKIKLFNVDHGDCILITFPNGDLGLIDSKIPENMENNPAYDEILKKGYLKLLCLTHPHLDHFQGMFSILSEKNIKVEKFIHTLNSGLQEFIRFHNEFSEFLYEDAIFLTQKAVLDSNKKRGKGELINIMSYVYNEMDPANYEEVSELKRLKRIGDVKIWILSPSSKKSNNYKKKLVELMKEKYLSLEQIKDVRSDANSISAVILLQFGKRKVLLGGDASSSNWSDIFKLEEKGDDWFPVDVLKASHHGSKDSFYKGMWSDVLSQNGHILVSCGKKDHPSKEFIESIDTSKYKLYCTNKGNFCGSQENDPIPEYDTDNICFDWIEVIINEDDDYTINVNTGRENQCNHCKNKKSSIIVE